MNKYIIYDKSDKKTKTLAKFTIEQYLNRRLKKNERVLHKDGNKYNNDINNLIIKTIDERNKCDVCGVLKDKNKLRKFHGIALCSKHYNQIQKYGKIIDQTSTSIQEKNKIFKFDTYAEIQITNKKQEFVCNALIDLDDIEKVKKYKWHAIINKNGNVKSIETNYKNKKISLHRLILNYEGVLPIDHINRNPTDNRKENLRIVEPITNSQNIKRSGIRKTKDNKWTVNIRRFNKNYYLGTFDSVEDATKKQEAFYKWFKENEKFLLEEYLKLPKYKYIYRTPSGKWKVRVFKNGKKYDFSPVEKLNEAIKIRDEWCALNT